MTRAEAEVLAAFVNRCGVRYRAMPLSVGDWPDAEAWVLLAERASGHTRVPAWDARECLEWLERRSDLLREGRDLLDRWLSEWETADRPPSPHRMAEQVAALGPRPHDAPA